MLTKNKYKLLLFKFKLICDYSFNIVEIYTLLYNVMSIRVFSYFKLTTKVKIGGKNLFMIILILKQNK